MESLRETAEKDLYDCIESEFGTVVEITSPNGTTQIYNANEPTELLKGMLRMYSRRENPETGETIVVDQPSILLRTSSLSNLPQPGNTDNWYIKVATSPLNGAVKKSFAFTIDSAVEKGTDLGIMKLFLHELTQSTIVPVESES